MAKGYWIGTSDITDFPSMMRYREANQQVLQRYGAKFLVVGGSQDIAEGATRSRQTVVEFETYDLAKACYEDPEYQKAALHRRDAATGSLVIVEGFEPPKPN